MSARPLRPEGDVALVADVHIGRDDPDLAPFRRFLLELGESCSVVVLMGDIFSLWLGRPKFTQEHHRQVLETCRKLRRRGREVVFVEGNREYGARCWRGDAFDRVNEQVAIESWGGRRWYLAHGDLLDRADLKNRVFRAIVRSAPASAAVGLLGPRVGLGLAHSLERSLRHRNLRRKTRIPPTRLDRYLRWLEAHGFDAGAIGHIHVEMQHSSPGSDGRSRDVYVLPDWRSGRRFLRIPRDAPPRFEAWREAPPPAAAVIFAAEEGPEATLRLERPAAPEPGTPVAISSGHGPEVRRGRVLTRSSGAVELRVRLEPGPPVQVGDRLLVGELPPQN